MFRAVCLLPAVCRALRSSLVSARPPRRFRPRPTRRCLPLESLEHRTVLQEAPAHLDGRRHPL